MVNFSISSTLSRELIVLGKLDAIYKPIIRGSRNPKFAAISSNARRKTLILLNLMGPGAFSHAQSMIERSTVKRLGKLPDRLRRLT